VFAEARGYNCRDRFVGLHATVRDTEEIFRSDIQSPSPFDSKPSPKSLYFNRKSDLENTSFAQKCNMEADPISPLWWRSG
jgi:hypothetical protein